MQLPLLFYCIHEWCNRLIHFIRGYSFSKPLKWYLVRITSKRICSNASDKVPANCSSEHLRAWYIIMLSDCCHPYRAKIKIRNEHHIIMRAQSDLSSYKLAYITVGMKYNYNLWTSTCINIMLSYTVLENCIKNEKQSPKQVEAETQGLIR